MKTQRTRSKRRFALTLALGAVCVWLLIAFASFVRDVNALSVPVPAIADGIVVVTGGSERIEVALELLEEGAAERLLISGVHETTGVEALARRTQTEPSLFECCVDLGYAALDTAGNARETANWAREHDFTSLLVVTSAYHIPRTTREIKRLLPSVDLIPVPIDPYSGNRRAAAAETTSWPITLLAREFMKLQLARLRHLAATIV